MGISVFKEKKPKRYMNSVYLFKTIKSLWSKYLLSRVFYIKIQVVLYIGRDIDMKIYQRKCDRFWFEVII